MHNFKYFFTILFFSLILFSCKEKNENKDINIDDELIKEKIVSKNQDNVSLEDRQIDSYLERRDWDFEKTNTGLRYKIYKKGYGLSPKDGDEVLLSFKVNLIRGEEVYNSKDDGKLSFVIGKSDEISGLHEAVKLMKTGAKAKFIIPSYLAYGLTGDDKKIPRNATLIYDLELLQVRK